MGIRMNAVIVRSFLFVFSPPVVGVVLGRYFFGSELINFGLN